jgi:CheY-like chemotaxis protein
VLLAEDNVVNQKLAVAMLTRLGHKATVVGDGAAAVALVQQRRFDAILMDVQMPHMSGIDATRAIRAYEARLGIRTPIIAMTANAFAEDRDRCIEAGMDEYLSKPVARELLAGTLARLCALPAGAPPATSAPPPAAAPPDPPQFQRETTLQSLAGDAELLAELATIFIATCSGQLESLKQAAGRDDWAAVAQIAHSLKGGAAVFGALRCVSAARQVEALARAEDAATHAALAELETAARGLVDELRQSIDVRAAETP